MPDHRITDAHHALNAGDITRREFDRITRSLKESQPGGLTGARKGRKVSLPTPIDKEPIMARTSRTTKSDTTPSAKATKAKTPPVTAASVARDAGIDPFKFRVFLRANGVKRDARSLRAAVKKFKADAR